jgi:sugar/nucleoside kinase (ribokinase family)
MRPLAVAGNVNVDIIVGPLEPWPAPGTEVVVAHEEVRPGGAAGNVALAWRRLGVPCQTAANVGADMFGRFLRDRFGASADRWPVAATGTTLSIGVTHPCGERTFITTRGHLESFTIDQVLASLDGDRLRGGILLLCGSFLMPHVAAGYDALFAWADARSIDVALDTGWPPGGWTEETVRTALGWVAHCRHLLLNEVETGALARTGSPEDAARSLVAGMRGENAVVVIKQGPQGALACSALGEIVRVPARNVEIVDTIGAGDAFDAGYLAAVAAGEPTEAALRGGVEVASAAISGAYGREEGAILRVEGQPR